MHDLSAGGFLLPADIAKAAGMTNLPRYTSKFAIGLCALALSACAETPGEISRDAAPFDGIDAAAKISAGGTEPFWGLEIEPQPQGFTAKYSTPDRPDGEPFAVTRFAGNNGLGFSGQWEGKAAILALTPGQCSDGMSDSIYPYTATLLLGDDTLYGCAHTDLEPITGGEGAP